MGKKFVPPDDFDDDFAKEPTPVIDLPYYETLRTVLEPYTPAADEASADRTFTSTEIIKAIEEHHGVPQGLQKGEAQAWVQPEDFVRAMQYQGYRAVNTGGMQLEWLLKNKQ
jgi:hypothetical protein